jgi:hypothetical protein
VLREITKLDKKRRVVDLWGLEPHTSAMRMPRSTR